MNGGRNINKQKLLITGATGFTGLHACAYFVRQGCTVVAAGRNKKTLDSIQDVISAECHLEDREQVNDLIQTNRPDYILHLAGKIQLRSRGSILLHIWRVMLWAPSICLRLFGGIVRTVAW